MPYCLQPYYIPGKDHLGNTRITFTTQEQTDVYIATIEEVRRAIEITDFDHISE
jgi:hypothetical protein